MILKIWIVNKYIVWFKLLMVLVDIFILFLGVVCLLVFMVIILSGIMLFRWDVLENSVVFFLKYLGLIRGDRMFFN